MPKKTAKDAPSFETSLEELENIVSRMESENLPLEDLLKNYERGHHLINHCQGILMSAKERIEVVKVTQNSKDTSPTQSPANKETQSDDIQLF